MSSNPFKNIVEALRYIAPIITLITIVLPFFLGKDAASIYYLEIATIVFAIITAIVLWPLLKRIIIRVTKSIVNFFINNLRQDIKNFIVQIINDAEPEIQKIISRLRPQNMLNYELSGAILKKEGYRHIATRVETIQLIFEETLLRSDATFLKEMGRKIGMNFVQKTWPDMSDFMIKKRYGSEKMPEYKNTEMDMLNRINLWADMEVTAGWGKFEPELKFVNGELFGVIKIHECFLAVGRNNKDACLCTFLEGYLESMLSGLANRHIKIFETHCGRDAGVDKICFFRVESELKKHLNQKEAPGFPI
ncbi:MAG: hypothetical protein HYS21_08955 [Deltaproteobacteria bacterium]|nr:hypothetical protein [Deltaproteobacteria bacterium]